MLCLVSIRVAQLDKLTVFDVMVMGSNPSWVISAKKPSTSFEPYMQRLAQIGAFRARHVGVPLLLLCRVARFLAEYLKRIILAWLGLVHTLCSHQDHPHLDKVCCTINLQKATSLSFVSHIHCRSRLNDYFVSSLDELLFARHIHGMALQMKINISNKKILKCYNFVSLIIAHHNGVPALSDQFWCDHISHAVQLFRCTCSLYQIFSQIKNDHYNNCLQMF